MAGLKINERIAFLRKQRKLTQEQLATALGVTNQSVSKWESGQCCPDIQLLPEIARFFHISTDLLLGYEADSGLDDLCFQLEEHLSGMTEQEVLENSGKITALLGKAAMKKRPAKANRSGLSHYQLTKASLHTPSETKDTSAPHKPFSTEETTMKKGITIAGNMLTDNVKTISSYPKIGMLADVYNVQRAVGGCVPNTILDLAKMKGDIPLFAAGKVGYDDAGRFICQTLEEAGVDTKRVTISSAHPTSFSDVMSAMDTGERTFFHHRGANAEFSPADLPPESLQCDLLHIGYILLLDEFDKPDDEYGTVMARYLHDVQSRGIATSIDVVSGDGQFREKVVPALKYCDYAIMNEIEGCSVSGLPARDEHGKIIVENIVKTLELFMEKGVRRRAVLHSPEAGFCMDVATGLSIVPSFKLPKGYIKGSVGAGDAFCAGCLYAIYKGYDADWMLRYAAAAAAANLSQPDSVSGMKTDIELKKFMETWEVNTL